MNVATATGTSPDPDEPEVPVDPGEKEDPIEDPKPSLKLEKVTTSTPADGAYVLDEQITYKITVTNDGNVTLTNVQITDPLTGDSWTIATLAPNESKEYTSKAYTVTVDDVVADSVTNKVTATAKDPNNKDVTAEAEVTDDTKKRNDNDVDPKPDPDDPGEEMDVESKSITVVYDGKAHTLTATATAEGSTVWYQYDGGEWTTTPPSRVAVGTTTFSIKATNPAYEDVVKDGYSLTVTPATLTITIDDKSKVYGTEDPEFTYTVEGLVNGETIPDGLIKLWREEGEDVGTYPIHGKIGEGEAEQTSLTRPTGKLLLARAYAKTTFDPNNYSISFKDGTLEITPAKVTVTADDQTKQQYAADPELTVTIDGLVNGDDESAISYTVSREEGEDPGEYIITPSGEATQGNYEVEFVTGTLTITAAPAEKTFTLLWVSDLLLKGEGATDDAFKAIVDYAKTVKCDATVDTGNIVDASDNEAAWTSAKEIASGLKKLFSVAGAKDVDGDSMNYDAYLEAGLNGNVTAFEDGSVWYAKPGSQPVLMVGIGYQKIAETDEEKERQDKWLAFVNEAIAAHEKDFVVLVVNDYIDETGALTAFGKFIEEQIVEGNENVRLILCGNANGAATLEKTYGERKVAAVMYNYAADEEKGLGFLRILTIDTAAKTVKIETVNAITGATEYDEANPDKDNFVLEGLFE